MESQYIYIHRNKHSLNNTDFKKSKKVEYDCSDENISDENDNTKAKIFNTYANFLIFILIYIFIELKKIYKILKIKTI